MALIKWQNPTQEAFDQAANDAQVMVFYFGEMADDNQFLKNADIDGLVLAKSVVCFRVAPRTEVAADTDKATGKAPKSPLLAADLWKAYGVDKADTYVVTDRYGNRMANEKTGLLKQHVDEVSKHFRGVRKDIRKLTAAAEEAVAAKDTATAIKKLHEAFEFGVVGYKESDAAEALYKELMDAAAEEVTKAGTDVSKLKALAKVYAGSDMEKTIDAARAKAETPKG